MSILDALDKRATALTVAEVASLLNISQRQIYCLAAHNRIPCFHVGSSVRFDPATLQSWIRARVEPWG
jgi:excisionase family DNA binding protein